MVELDEALEQWLKEVQRANTLTMREKQKITKAGAKVYAKALEEKTREIHYSSHNDQVHGHLADSVIVSNKNIDGIKNGTTTIGFDHYHATVARQLNNGTIKYPADHFIEKIRDESTEAVFKKMKKTYQKILKKKGLQIC